MICLYDFRRVSSEGTGGYFGFKVKHMYVRPDKDGIGEKYSAFGAPRDMESRDNDKELQLDALLSKEDFQNSVGPIDKFVREQSG